MAGETQDYTYVNPRSSGSDVRLYGAKGDGTTDDTVAFQAIFNAVPSGTAILVPAGYTFNLTQPITLTKQIKLFGGGTLLWTSGIVNASALTISADGTLIDDVIFKTNVAGSQTGTKQFGIWIQANNVTVEASTVDSFQGGIAISPTGEWANIKIINNRIKDVQGAGDGPSNTTSTFGEDRGDGIVCWGSQATITGNIVNCATGKDARIGIHAEALSASEGTQNPPHPDSMITISGNVVFGAFRRGITSEGVTGVTIDSNTVADSTWWGISLNQGANFCTVSGNTVNYTRPATDLTGQAWSPKHAALMIYGNTFGSKMIGNTVVASSAGAADAYIYFQGPDATHIVTECEAIGNTCRNVGTGAVANGVYMDTNITDLRVTENHISGVSTRGVYGFGSIRANVRGNTLIGVSATIGVLLDGDGTAVPATVSENHIRGFTTGINRSNSQNNRISNNTIENATTGVDFFGCTNSKAIDNIMVTVTTPYANAGGAGLVTTP